MNLFLVRHGQTEGNVLGRLVGWQDIDLTDVGKQQAELTAEALYNYATAEGLTIHTIYSSPLRRALLTAMATSKRFGLDPILDSDLREIHFGDIEGLTADEWHERYPELAAAAVDADNRDFTWPNGEVRGDFYNRVVTVIDRLIAAHAEDENIIIVSHGGVISSFIAHVVAGNPSLWRDYRADNCSITRLSVDDGKANSPSCLVSFNDISHLGDDPVRTWWPKTT